MASDNEQQNQVEQEQQEQQEQQDQHSIWNGRFKTSPKEGKFFLEFLDALGARFDGLPTEDILETFWGEPRDVLEKLIKKANKREKKAETKFTPEGLKKAPTANILFQRDFKARCDKNGTKFDLKSSSDAYKALSDKEKAKYIKESDRLKAEYKAEYERLRVAAIQSGAFPADKPKKPMTAYFRYLQVVRAELTAKYAADTDRKAVNSKIAKDSAEMWKSLSENEKEKYDNAYRREKEQYDEIIKKWDVIETSRRKGQDSGATAAEPVNIESSGSDKKKVITSASTPASTPVKVATAATSVTASENEASEAEEQEVVKPAKVSKTAKVVPAKAISESDQEEEVEVAVPKAKNTKLKAATKSK